MKWIGRTIGVLGTAKGQWPLASKRGNKLLIKLDFLPGKGSSAATRRPRGRQTIAGLPGKLSY